MLPPFRLHRLCKRQQIERVQLWCRRSDSTSDQENGFGPEELESAEQRDGALKNIQYGEIAEMLKLILPVS
ncbi:hypothetical protein NicSoilC5_08890 [Arthrobacter sp. NicSoilC5]|nr:hypothetical protein NicSoilC5_08890 [Arthrobacter sp. NicSoilC5]